MHTVNLDADTQARLSELTKLTGKAPEKIVGDAVRAYAEEVEDARAADEVLDRIDRGDEATVSLKELERRLGVGD